MKAEAVTFDRSSTARLTEYDLARFTGTTLFDRLARAVCEAGCLPRKELFEAWEVAKRARRLFRGGRIVDVAASHGLLGTAMLILDDSSPEALIVDPAISPCARSLHAVLVSGWPRVNGRVQLVNGSIEDMALGADDVVVSSHACGALTDRIIDRAVEVRARVAVLPCCQDMETCDPGALEGWLDGPMAVDVMRAVRLQQHGYRVWTQVIPHDITPKNRLLLGAPAD